MTMQDWGALGDLIGGIAIIVSLVYVGLQIKQSTQATRAATNQSFSAQYTEQAAQITRADFRDVFWRGLSGLQNLQGGELVAFMAFLGSIMRMWETFYFQKQGGTFESRIFDSWLVQLVDLFGNDGVREYWAIRRHNFTAEFVEFIDETIATATPKPMHPNKA